MTDLEISNDDNNNDPVLGPRDDGQDELGGTPVQRFYAGQKILVTGGTGFLGKILTEKLLRCCPDLARIYLLVRPKKGKSAESRLTDLFQDRVFDRMRKLAPCFREKIVPIHGDCQVKGLGISEEDSATLCREVSIVFHVAATVRFDEELKLATAINVRSTGDVLDLSKRMPKLKAFVHVSTAYANCHLRRVEERFYDYPIRYQQLLGILESEPLEEHEKAVARSIKAWPNTYTFTKAVTENLIRERAGDLPVAIFRPAIVISTAEEPIPGWIDNLYGPTGVVAAGVTGIMKVITVVPEIIADLVPVDLTVNALIVSAWDVHTQRERRGEDALIYNYVSSVEAPLTWGLFSRLMIKFAEIYPPNNCMWYHSYIGVRSRIAFVIVEVFVHFLPALIVDFISICMGQKPRLCKMYVKVHKFSGAISYFCLNDWRFTNNNVREMWLRASDKDKRLFNFKMAQFDWMKYFEDYVLGIRTYLLNEDPKTVPACRVKAVRRYWLDRVVRGLLLLAMAWMFWSVVRLAFS